MPTAALPRPAQTLTEPTAVTVTLTPTNASSSTAADGSITAVPAGGTNPYV